MEVEVTPAFPTLIGRLQIPDADAMNLDLRALILAEEAKYRPHTGASADGYQPGWGR